MADLLCDRGCDVTEVRLLRQAGQAKVLVRFPTTPTTPRAWPTTCATPGPPRARAAAGEGPLQWKIEN